MEHADEGAEQEEITIQHVNFNYNKHCLQEQSFTAVPKARYQSGHMLVRLLKWSCLKRINKRALLRIKLL